MGKGKSFKKGYQSNCVSEKQQQTHRESTLWLPRRRGGGGKDQEFETSGCKLSYRMDKQGPPVEHRGLRMRRPESFCCTAEINKHCK